MQALPGIPLALILLCACPHDTSRAADQPAPANTPAAPPPGASRPAAREQVPSDTPRATPGGARFVAPAGWWIETLPNAVILTPEGDSRIALVDARHKDADEA